MSATAAGCMSPAMGAVQSAQPKGRAARIKSAREKRAFVRGRKVLAVGVLPFQKA